MRLSLIQPVLYLNTLLATHMECNGRYNVFACIHRKRKRKRSIERNSFLIDMHEYGLLYRLQLKITNYNCELQ